LSKFLYFIMGLAAAVVAASGVNLWLAKREKDDPLADLWVGIVWGTPLALCTSALLSRVSVQNLDEAFWLTLFIACVSSIQLRNVYLSRQILRMMLLIALTIILTGHLLTYGNLSLTGPALWINALLGILISVIWIVCFSAKKGQIPAGIGPFGN